MERDATRAAELAAGSRPMSTKLEELYRRFDYHPAIGDQPDRYSNNRYVTRITAAAWFENCPESRELSLAYTHLQQALMWANAAIALNESPAGPGAV